MSVPLLEVRDLVKHFPIQRGFLRRTVGTVRAVDGVSFDVLQGETLGLVGESGSGKSTLARTVLRLEEPTSGSVRFDGEELAGLAGEALRLRRRHMQMIFQDPFASLNPRMRVGSIVREPLDIHRVGEPRERDGRVAALLERVGLERRSARHFPHQLSGGQRQRVGIARALATGPRLIVADEPISALDVSIQAQIVNLLQDLKDELGLTYLLIAHDLSMVRHACDRVAVMYLGRLVETGARADVFDRPRHPYTRALIASIPVPDPERQAARAAVPLEGDVPSPAAPPPGCRFHTRCPFAVARCRVEEPGLREVAPGQLVACHRAEELA
ncbi:MAG TPA: oligopeptide/dipeptide ABC transporter ATP-binding protein [Longimicrobiales bacterium]|nr:oligopeptide/dipeptide ABC transporter ATP-binding protein [Longimicrobiales bacterium]